MMQAPPVYTDFSQLAALKHGAKENEAENIDQVARQFESLFTHMVIKSMRQANLGEDMMGNNGSDMYRDLFDRQIALSLSQGKGLGLAKAMQQQLHSPGANRPETVQPLKADNTDKTSSHTLAKPQVLSMPLQHVLNPQKVPDTAIPLRHPSGQTTATDPVIPEQSYIHRPGATRGMRHIETSSSQREAALRAYGVIQAQPAETAMQHPIQSSGLNTQAVKPPAPLQTDVLRLDQAQKHAQTENTPESFIAKLWPAAQRIADELGVSPRVLIAQAALETGWGNSMPKHTDGSSGNNYFGIKGHGQWQGRHIDANTTEIISGKPQQERASFRAYNSIEDSFRDFANFLKTNPRYEGALAVTHNANKFVDALQKAGYATDPKYADKIKSIMNGRRMNTMVAQIDSGPTARQVG